MELFNSWSPFFFSAEEQWTQKLIFHIFCYCYSTLSQHLLNLLIHQPRLFLWHHYGSWMFCLFPLRNERMVNLCTIYHNNGSLVSFLQFFRKYLPALRRLGISGGDKVATSRWIWLNSASSSGFRMLNDGVCGNIFISSWQSRLLSSQYERISILVETKGLVEMVAFSRFWRTGWLFFLVDHTKWFFRFCTQR